MAAEQEAIVHVLISLASLHFAAKIFAEVFNKLRLPAVLVWGVGHIYLGRVIRGITILINGIVVAFVIPWFIPYPWSWIIPIGFWIWQMFDAYKHYDKLNSTNSNCYNDAVIKMS